MSHSPYIPVNSPELRRVVKKIPPHNITSEYVQGIIDFMINTGEGEARMMGLAAHQTGFTLPVIIISNRAFSSDRPCMDYAGASSFKVYINPEVTFSSDEEEKDIEGCFSVPGCVGVVPRAKKIRITAYDREGNEVSLEPEGFISRVFQHEIDHLNGLMYPDRIFRFDSESRRLHLLHQCNDSPNHCAKRLQEYKNAVSEWKSRFGDIEGFTWRDVISKKIWECDIAQSGPEWDLPDL